MTPLEKRRLPGRDLRPMAKNSTRSKEAWVSQSRFGMDPPCRVLRSLPGHPEGDPGASSQVAETRLALEASAGAAERAIKSNLIDSVRETTAKAHR